MKKISININQKAHPNYYNWVRYKIDPSHQFPPIMYELPQNLSTKIPKIPPPIQNQAVLSIITVLKQIFLIVLYDLS